MIPFFKSLMPAFLRAAALSLPLAAAMPCAPADGAPSKVERNIPYDIRGPQSTQADSPPTDFHIETMRHEPLERSQELLACVKPPFSEMQLKKINAALGSMDEWFRKNGLRDKDGLMKRVTPESHDNVSSALVVIQKFDKVYKPGTEGGLAFLKDPLATLMLAEDYNGYVEFLLQILTPREEQELQDFIEPLRELIMDETNEASINLDDQISNACADKGGTKFLDDLARRQAPFPVVTPKVP